MRLPNHALAALAPAGLAPLDGATAVGRDRHFAATAAIAALIERGVRAPADRQMSEFQAAGYPDPRWCELTLEWLHADRLRSEESDPAAAKRLRERYAKPTQDIEGANERADIPAVVNDVLDHRESPLLRLVNDLGRIINPNLPPPLTDLHPEAERGNRLVREIVAEAVHDFAIQAEKVKAFEATKEPAFCDLAENDPRYRALAQEGALIRLAAVKPLCLAHLVLREVITRGHDFGLDPQPAADALTMLLKEHAAWLSKWDFDWGDNCLPLKAQTMRRTKNSLTVMLAKRYLGTFATQGVDAQPPFRVETASVGDRTWALFVDREAPAIVGPEVVDDDGDPVVVFVPEGRSGLAKAPAKAGARAPAAEPETGTP